MRNTTIILGDCPAGTRFVELEGRCEECWKNSYQPFPKQNYCHPCPEGFVTESFGSITAQECQGE